jgi:hypothetical protein
MPKKHPNTERFGGPGSSKQDRDHPEKFHKDEGPEPGEPTSDSTSKISGGGGERDKHHSHDPKYKSWHMPGENVKYISPEKLAELLTEVADGLTTREYTSVLGKVLGDLDTETVASIAEHMSPDLQALLPKKFLH